VRGQIGDLASLGKGNPVSGTRVFLQADEARIRIEQAGKDLHRDRAVPVVPVRDASRPGDTNLSADQMGCGPNFQ
jgi:hypothetical protein